MDLHAPPPATPQSLGGDAAEHFSIDARFVATTWAWCLAATALLFAMMAGVLALVSDASLVGEAGTELGVLTIAAASSTFIGFVLVMTMRLVRVSHDRLVNSMAVSGLHVAVALVVFLATLALASLTSSGPTDLFGASWSDAIGNVFVLLERSAAMSVIACLLAVGMVPAAGARPRGTQQESLSSDLQL